MDIFLVEDSPLIRERIAALLGTVPGARVVGHAEGADEAVQEILDRRPDLVVLDLRLAQGSGFDVLRTLRPLLPRTDFCMLSSFASEPYRRAAMQLGAVDFFDKTREMERMLDVVAARAGRYAHA